MNMHSRFLPREEIGPITSFTKYGWTHVALTFDITGAARLHRAASVLMDGLGNCVPMKRGWPKVGAGDTATEG
jgi:hypothetical protein